MASLVVTRERYTGTQGTRSAGPPQTRDMHVYIHSRVYTCPVGAAAWRALMQCALGSARQGSRAQCALDTRSSLAYGKTANAPSRPVPHIHPGDTGFSAAIQPWQRPPFSGGGLFTQCSLSQYPVSLVLLFPHGQSLFPIRGVPTGREVMSKSLPVHEVGVEGGKWSVRDLQKFPLLSLWSADRGAAANLRPAAPGKGAQCRPFAKRPGQGRRC